MENIVLMGIGVFIIFSLIDIREGIKKANQLKEEELELLKKQIVYLKQK